MYKYIKKLDLIDKNDKNVIVRHLLQKRSDN